MNFDTVPDKQLQHLERLTSELWAALKQAKLQDEPLTEEIYRLHQHLGNVRRERYDKEAKQYDGY